MLKNIKLDKKLVQEIIIATLMIILIPSFQSFYMYFRNVGIVQFRDFAPFILLFLGITLVLSFIFFIFLRSFYKSALLACIFILIFINYRHFENLIQTISMQIRYWHLAPIVIVIYMHIVYLIAKKIPQNICKIICNSTLFAFCILLIVNISMAIPSVISRTQTDLDYPQSIQLQDQRTTQSNSVENLPNVYLFIFDEYAGFEQLEYVYNYSNAAFKDFLISNQFKVSPSSRNHSIWTHVVVPNMINLGQPNNLEINRPILYTLLESFGYEVRGVGDTSRFFLQSNTEDYIIETRTIEGDSIETLIIGNTLIYPFIPYRITSLDRRDSVLNAFSYIQDIQNLPDTPTFTFFYIISPHAPFIFDEFGESVNPINQRNYENPQFYLGQLRFITSQIKETVEFLMENDPDSVIILMSDHGARFNIENNEEYYMLNILNAVYFRGEEIEEIDGLSGANTLITIFNRLLGTELSLSEDS